MGQQRTRWPTEGQVYWSTSQEDRKSRKHGPRKALLKLPCRNRSPHTGCLHSAGFRYDCKQVVFLYDALSILQAYQNHKLPNLTKALHEGCSAVDSSPLWNIRKWASGHPGKGGCQRITACQQCQLQWKEDSHQSTHNAKITEGWLPPAFQEAASHSGEASHLT